MGNQPTIEINGKIYDAATGKQLSESASKSVSPVTITPTKNVGVVDGFVKRPTRTKSRPKPQHASKVQQKSKTLMRSAVKKPTAQITKPHVSAPHELKKKLGTSPARLHNAQEVKRSPSIQKYGQPNHVTSVVKKTTEMRVKPHPTENTTGSVKHPAHHNQAINHNKNHRPAADNKAHSSSNKAAHKMIEAALTNAQSHSEPLHKPPKKRSKLAKKLGISAKTASISSAVLAGVLLGGFFAIQNVPNLSMRVAASRAGFNAEIPGYKPSGFSFKGPISYSSGQVKITYKSNTDNRNYSLTQRSSNWNSDALLANYVIAENKQYQTYLDRGRTLYIYDGSNATWVDNGIWYQVEGNSNMTTDQLVRIASSI